MNSLDDNEWIQNCRDELKDSDALKIQETSFKDSFFDEGQKIYGEIRRLKGENFFELNSIREIIIRHNSQ